MTASSRRILGILVAITISTSLKSNTKNSTGARPITPLFLTQAQDQQEVAVPTNSRLAPAQTTSNPSSTPLQPHLVGYNH